MVLNYLGAPAEYDRLVSLLRIQEWGSPFHNLARLEALGVKVLVERGEIESLQSCLARQLPPVVLVDTGQLPYWNEATGHAVVIVGIEGGKIYLNDPAFPDAPRAVSMGDFELAWIDADQFYALISLA